MLIFRAAPCCFLVNVCQRSLLESRKSLLASRLKDSIRSRGACSSNVDLSDESVRPKTPPWRILFFGSDTFALRSLEMLCSKFRTGTLINVLDVTTTSALDWRKKHNPIYEFAKSEKLTLYNWPVVVEDIKHKYDVGVIVSFGYLIPKDIIESFPLGILNVHGSLLPRWRGPAPIIRAIMNGNTETGITIMKIHPEKFDTGDIVRQYSITINRNETAKNLHARMAELGGRLLMECIRDLPRCIEFAMPQSHEGVSYARKITESTAKVNWNRQSAEEVYNQFRALSHIFPLTTSWFGIPIKLLHVELDDIDELNPENRSNIEKLGTKTAIYPGLVEYSRRRCLLRIQCSDGQWVCVNTVLVSGKKTLSASQFYNGFLSKVPNSLERRFGVG